MDYSLPGYDASERPCNCKYIIAFLIISISIVFVMLSKNKLLTFIDSFVGEIGGPGSPIIDSTSKDPNVKRYNQIKDGNYVTPQELEDLDNLRHRRPCARWPTLISGYTTDADAIITARRYSSGRRPFYPRDRHTKLKEFKQERGYEVVYPTVNNDALPENLLLPSRYDIRPIGLDDQPTLKKAPKSTTAPEHRAFES